MTSSNIITNATRHRFLNGSFERVDGTWVFNGIVVSGHDLTYDDTTGAPSSGHVSGIQLQTRCETEVLSTRGDYPVNAPVTALCAAFASTGAVWYDPCHYPALDTDTSIDGSSDSIAEQIAIPPQTLDTRSKGFTLVTGDIVSKQDLRAIFAEPAKGDIPAAKAEVAPERLRDASVIALMHKVISRGHAQDHGDTSPPASQDEYKFA